MLIGYSLTFNQNKFLYHMRFKMNEIKAMQRNNYLIDKERAEAVGKTLRAIEGLELENAITLLEIFSNDSLQDVYFNFLSSRQTFENDDKGLQALRALTANQIHLIMKIFYLNENQLQEVRIALSKRINHIIANTSITLGELANLMRIPATDRQIHTFDNSMIFSLLINKLPDMIVSLDSLAKLVSMLDSKQLTQLLSRNDVKAKIKELTVTPADLAFVLKLLPPQEILDSENILAILKNLKKASDFEKIMRDLPNGQRDALLKNNELIQKLQSPEIIVNISCLMSVISYLTDNQCRKIWCDRFTEVIKTPGELVDILAHDHDKFHVLFGVINLNPNKWREIIKNRDDLILVLNALKTRGNQYTKLICESVLGTVIKTNEQLDSLENYLEASAITEFKARIKSYNPFRVSQASFLTNTVNNKPQGGEVHHEDRVEYKMR